MLTIREDSLNWALAHAVEYGDTDVFPVPFEYRALEADWDRCRSFLAEQDLLRWAVRPHRTLLAPKGPRGFRPITQLDPLDFLLFAGAVREIAGDLEAARLPVREQIVFSYRTQVNADGALFSREPGYHAFLGRAGEILDERADFAFVVTTDIADFYPRIYHHRLEGALRAATTKSSHVSAVMRLLNGWNASESYGIPIGSDPTRLLAEVALADTDEALLNHGVVFIRYVDDYRIFSRTYAEAYRHLSFLADTLYRAHGLSLQAQKTTILPAAKFEEIFLRTDSEREFAALHEKFGDIIDALGLGSPYEFIDYERLNAEQRALVDSLNLIGLFEEAVSDHSDVDLRVVRFVLRRLTQLQDETLIDALLDKIEVLYPIYRDIIQYIESVGRGSAPARRRELGQRLVQILTGSLLSDFEYYRQWTLDLFARSPGWCDNATLTRLAAEFGDQFSQRKLILARSAAGDRGWFQAQWRNAFDQAAWPRRALIAGAACMPREISRHWYRSIRSRLDVLEHAVTVWCEKGAGSP